MSIRLRLTLLYSAILALTLIAFSSILYVSQTQTTYAGIRSNLMRQAAVFGTGIGRFPGQEGRPPGTDGSPAGGAPEARPAPSAPDPSTSGALPGRWTQTRSITGTVIAHTFDLSGAVLPLSDAGLRSVRSGSGWFETAQVQEQPLLIYSQSFTAQSGAKEIVQVAFPIALSVQSLNSLRLVLIAGSSLAILAAFAIGWGLAGAALRPIHRITQTAQAIGAEHSFARRVEHLGPSDEVGQLAVTFNDMLAELEAAYRQLEAALDSQRRFVADASHELRTPLTTVRGNIELLRHDPPLDAQERAEVIADTRDEVDRLIRLVNQLLALARADAGQQLRREPLPLKPLLEDVCRQMKVIAPQGLILCDPPPDLQVVGDHDALKQVLLALLDNALVHTSAGAAIRLTSAAEGNGVAICVRDTGRGIPPETLPHIFERFYRGDIARTGNGSGLGLAIARELVEAQGGDIAVESQLGQGTVFTVRLPMPS